MSFLLFVTFVSAQNMVVYIGNRDFDVRAGFAVLSFNHKCVDVTFYDFK